MRKPTFRNAFLICAVPRSGSHLLCELLQATAVAGHPMEYGILADELTWKNFHGYREHRAYFDDYVSSLCVSDNGVFGAKMMFEQMQSFAVDLVKYHLQTKGDVLDVIDRGLGKPRYIGLSRRDKKRQAISLARAMQTGSWSSIHASNPARYDRELIERAEQAICRQERQWEEVLENVEPSRRIDFLYEEIVEDMEKSVETLLRWLEIREPARPFRPPSLLASVSRASSSRS